MEREKMMRNNRGSALMISVLAIVILTGMSGAILALTLSSNSEQNSATSDVKALYIAESGISHAMSNLTAGNDGQIGSYDAPISFSNGDYFVALVDNGDGTYTATSTGNDGRASRTLEAVLEPTGGGIFNNVIFAGNEDDDPNYTLSFGGCVDQADHIDGAVFSGGNVDIGCDAEVTGEIEASGAITGSGGTEGAYQPIPDLQSIGFDVNNDFDVAAIFNAEQRWAYDAAGGSAYQVLPDNPAHIFRKNPTDRAANVNSTVKDDFFLEDPYEPVQTDQGSTGATAYEISLTGVQGQPGANSNDSLFYIDGNLWIHNYKTFSFKLMSDTNGTHVTFVVKGNIYFSDNVFYEDGDLDGIAFIAMEDGQVSDSGNIYFGDPDFGTLEYMDSYMYAENNFFDSNLDAAGSATVAVSGIMSAGNQVSINRDFGDAHSKLTTLFDPRVADGNLELPGLPSSLISPGGWQVASWREVANP